MLIIKEKQFDYRTQREHTYGCSVPDDKDFLALERVLSLVDVLGEVLAIMGHFGPHVIDEEWLREVVFVIRIRHRLEVERHGGTALDIANLVLSNCRVAIGVEEFGERLAVLGEERIVQALFPLLVVVHHVVSLWAEESSQLLVLKDVVKHVHLIDSGLSTLVSDPRRRDQSRGDKMNFPERSMRAHHEREASVADQTACPHVVAAMQSGANLVQIVTGSHAPFPVVRVDHVRHIVGLGWISLRFVLNINIKVTHDSVNILATELILLYLQVQHHQVHGKVHSWQRSFHRGHLTA